MEVSKASIQKAVANNIISEQQGIALYNFFQEENQHTPSFTFTHILYYLGGLIAIGAMTLFMNLGWEQFGGAGIVFISMLYAGVGLKLANSFARKHLIIPAGICATFVVCLTPIAIYGAQQWLGLWPDDNTVFRQFHHRIKWLWLYMELGTLVTGLVVAWRYKYPFLIMPIAVTLWYISMDAVMLIIDHEELWNSYTWQFRALVSMYFGALMTLLAFWVDIRARNTADYAFWLYLFGVLAFWGGLTSQDSDSELSKFVYFCINLAMIGAGALLVRRVFVIFGALGSCLYLGHLASTVFEDSWLFPVALSAIGLGVVYSGIWWQKNEARIAKSAQAILPKALQELLANKARQANQQPETAEDSDLQPAKQQYPLRQLLCHKKQGLVLQAWLWLFCGAVILLLARQVSLPIIFGCCTWTTAYSAAWGLGTVMMVNQMPAIKDGQSVMAIGVEVSE